jgi:hypothetical protein
MTCPHCGASDARSVPQLRRFFAVVRAAFEQWPERDTFRPDNAEHLRAFLLCAAGWRTEVAIEIRDTQSANGAALAAKALMRATGHHCWITADGEKLTIYAPRSISFTKANHKAICRVFEDVEGIIANRLGIRDCDQLLKEKESAA